MKNHWQIANKKEVKDRKTLLEVLLKNRNIKTGKERKEFLNPTEPNSYSAQDLGIKKTQVEKAVDRVKSAVKNREHILVYGDYDADGICATAILWETLYALGAEATPFIPNRFEDGYGINSKVVKKLKEKHSELALIITVDNGIVAFDAVKTANELGIDVIVTDHHEPKEKPPEAYAVVHTTKTSGSGVACLFAQELVNKGLENDNSYELAAIGTVADQLPLLGFNRSLVKHGLSSLKNTQRIGLRKLFAVAGLLGKEVGTYEVNFIIAPRINASGRMAEGMDALRLLCTKNMGRAAKLAEGLNSLNLDRQQTVEDALKLAENNFPEPESSVIVLSSESYHEGVIGLIASRITEKYYRPTVVLSIRGEVAKASARSISGFNIIDAIRFHEELIIEGGGHEMAAGFSIDTKNISLFSQKINEYAKPLLLSEVIKRKINVDTYAHFSLINKEVYNMLSELEPYGAGNPAPVLAAKKVKIVSQKLVGRERNHLKLVLEKDERKINAILFNYSEEIKEEFVDIAFRLSENSWNGNTDIELIIKDIKYE